MSVLTPIISSLHRGVCRCCGAITKCRNLTEEYEVLGQKEVYANMLLHCFGIDLSHLNSKLDDKLVCTACVSRMRGALTFKMLVLRTEQDFLQNKMNAINSDSNNLPKKYPLELVDAEFLNIDHFEEFDLDNMPDGLDDELTPELLMEYELMDNFEFDFNCTEPDIVVSKQGTKRKMCGKLNKSSKEAKYRHLEDKDRYSSSDDDVLATLKVQNHHKNFAERFRINSNKHGSADEMNEQSVNANLKDMNFMLDTNIKAIVRYSYVCPFKCRFNHIICFYCMQNFVDPDLLREHTLTHDPTTFKFSRWSKNIKIDVMRVDCRLCTEKISDLETFKRHLVSVHGKRYYLDSKDCVLPFKLVKDVNRCALCNEDFPSFHVLSKHMNVHFSNYVCETCGLGFMDEIGLSKHITEHESRRFACRTCGRTFKSKYTRIMHIRRIHKKTAGSMCPKCDKFPLLHEKSRHMVEVHGDSPAVPCIACDKVFKSRRLLTYHLRREHMKAYKFECQMCCRKFYTSRALRLHMPTHTGERNYKCKICEKTYPRVTTLKQHMRIHNDDRRYKCTICGQAFIQNCSLKGHMKSKH